jgi:hypothetical protein
MVLSIRSGSKRQSLQWKQPTLPGPKKAHKSKSQAKTMFISFLDIKGTAHFESIAQGQTVKQAYYSIAKGLNFGPAIGLSTMTIFQLTRRSLSSNLWPKNRLLKWNDHVIPLI